MMPMIFLGSTVCLSASPTNWRFCAWFSQLGMLWCWSKQGNCLHGMRHVVLSAFLMATAENVSVLVKVCCAPCVRILRSRLYKADYLIRAICTVLLATAQFCFTNKVRPQCLISWQRCVANSMTVAQKNSEHEQISCG